MAPLNPDPLHVPEDEHRPTGAELAAMSDSDFEEWVRRQGIGTVTSPRRAGCLSLCVALVAVLWSRIPRGGTL